MFLVYDNASNNVLAECESFAEAEQKRIRIIGINPTLAEYVEVIDLDRTLDESASAAAREAASA